MDGHLFQNYESIFVRFFFCHVYLCSFLLCGVFVPNYMTIFLQTRIYMRTKKARVYALQTSIKITIKLEEQGKRGRWKAIKM